MESVGAAITLLFAAGVRGVRASIDPADAASFDQLAGALGGIEDQLRRGALGGASVATAQLDALGVTIDTDPGLAQALAWSREHTAVLLGALVDEARAVAAGLDATGLADAVAAQLRTLSLGLDARRAATLVQQAAEDAADLADTAAALLDDRAATIGDTEAADAVSRGQALLLASAIATGALPRTALRKRWVAQPSACLRCGALDGETVALDEEFDDGDPPLHPHCQCAVDVLAASEA